MAKFAKGNPKPPGSGRKKGQPTKLTLEARIRLEELGCDPLEGMARIAMDTKAPIELRGRMYTELAKYIWPQRKAVEHTGAGGGPIEMTDVSGIELLKSRIDSIASRIGQGNDPSRPH